MKTILLIEDHDMMRLFLANYFVSDYEVKAVSDVDLALNWLSVKGKAWELCRIVFQNMVL